MTYAEQTEALRAMTNRLAARTPSTGLASLMLVDLERETAWCERLVREAAARFDGSYETALAILGGRMPAAVARVYVARLRNELAAEARRAA